MVEKENEDHTTPAYRERRIKSVKREGVGAKDWERCMEKGFNILHSAYRLPDKGETAAIAIGEEKVAALFYDRVWSPYSAFVPEEIRFSGLTPTELQEFAQLELRFSGSDWHKDMKLINDWHKSLAHSESLIINLTEKSTKWTRFQRNLSNQLFNHDKVTAEPIYTSMETLDAEFPSGDKKVIVAALSMIDLPIEHKLKWQQVLELRKDKEAIENLRKLMYWFNYKITNKSVHFISEHLAICLNDYKNSLKKHGIKTALSFISGVLGSVITPAIISGLSSQPVWAALLEGIVITGSTLAILSEKYIESKPDPPPEIAWVYDFNNRID